jgi:peptidoglycan L-alanyl-D-glutamate endopeptidase CwlK
MERTMFAISVLGVFMLACACGWLLMFPAAMDALGARMKRAMLGMRGRLSATSRSGIVKARQAARMGQKNVVQTSQLARRHALLCTGAALVIALPSWLAIVVARRAPPAASVAPDHAADAHVMALLDGEQLVPPPPLPPDVFTTAEVTLLRPMLDSANRNWQQLNAEFSRRLLQVFRIMREQHGYELALLEGYRTPERQDQLAAAGPHVTNARAFQSYHQFGRAADCAFMRDGKLVISERDPWAMRGYQLYGQVAESVGLVWGGRWTMMDFGHCELRGAGS